MNEEKTNTEFYNEENDEEETLNQAVIESLAGWTERAKGLSGIGRVAVAGIIILVLVLIIGLIQSNKIYRAYTVLSETSRSEQNAIYYQPMDKGMLRYSKDGAMFINQKGTVVWNQTFSMSTPVAAHNDGYAAVGDVGSSQIYIFDVTGQVGQIAAAVPVVDLKISGNGVVAAILSDGTNGYINLYDRTGNTQLASIRVTIERTGYPVTMDISEDGTILAVSYICINGGNLETKLVFYDFSSSSQENKVIQEMTYNDIFPKLEFVDGQRLICYGEYQSLFLNVNSAGVTQVETLNFDQELRSVFASGQYVGFISRSADSSEGKYQMQVYNTSGRRILTRYFDFEYTNVAASNSEIILYSEKECRMYRYNGSTKFQGSFDSTISSIIPDLEQNQYVVVDNSSISTIRLR